MTDKVINSKQRISPKVIKIIAVAIMLWAFLRPAPFRLAIFSTALLPIIALTIMALNRGKNDLGVSKSFIIIALCGPSFVLAWESLVAVNILDYGKVWIPAVIVSILYAMAVFFFAADIRKKPLLLILLAISAFAYGYGLIIFYNCLPDREWPDPYCTTVISKEMRYEQPKVNTPWGPYYVTVTPWGPGTGPNEIRVRKDIYQSLNANDKATVCVKEGKLGIPWYYIIPHRK